MGRRVVPSVVSDVVGQSGLESPPGNPDADTRWLMEQWGPTLSALAVRDAVSLMWPGPHPAPSERDRVPATATVRDPEAKTGTAESPPSS